MSKLLGYRFEIQYKPRQEKKAADALSRVTPIAQLAALIVPTLLDVEVISNEVVGESVTHI